MACCLANFSSTAYGGGKPFLMILCVDRAAPGNSQDMIVTLTTRGARVFGILKQN
jgi:hypothetical protein